MRRQVLIALNKSDYQTIVIPFKCDLQIYGSYRLDVFPTTIDQLVELILLGRVLFGLLFEFRKICYVVVKNYYCKTSS